MSLIFFVAFVFLVVILFNKFKKKVFDPFIAASRSRACSWEWVKRIFFVVASTLLLIATWKRWYYFHDEMIYAGDKRQLAPQYETQVDVQVYLMSQQNVVDIFEGKPPHPDMQTVPKPSSQDEKDPEPHDPRFYMVVGIKNHGNRAIWGVLDCFIEKEPEQQIDVPSLPPHMKDVAYIVFPFRPQGGSRYGDYPVVETKWKQLYAAPETKDL